MCPSGSSELYRLYNNGAGGAPNHRYTTRRSIFDEMVTLGWTAEGNGPNAVFACVPDTDAGSDIAGIYIGVSSDGGSVTAFMLPNQQYYIVETLAGVMTERDVVNGTATAVGGAITSSDAYQYPIPSRAISGQSVQPISLAGTYTAGTSLQFQLGATATTASRSVTASYVSGSDRGPSLDSVVGQYTGYAALAGGRRPTRLSIADDGQLSGIADPAGNFEAACRFAGTLRAHGGIDLFDVTLTAVGAGECVFGSQGDTISGVVHYDPLSAKLAAFLPFFGRTNMITLIVNK